MFTDLAWLLPYLLFLHVLGAIAGFGPSFVFPIVGAMGGAEREHGNFAIRVSHTISSRLVYPIGITLPITGALIILVSGRNLADRANWWLGLAIVLYIIAYGYSFFVQRKTVERIIELTIGAAAARRDRSAAGAARPGQAGPARRDGHDGPAAGDHLPDGREAAVLTRAGGPGPASGSGVAVYHWASTQSHGDHQPMPHVAATVPELLDRLAGQPTSMATRLVVDDEAAFRGDVIRDLAWTAAFRSRTGPSWRPPAG